MPEEKTETCDHCGAKVVEYKHGLNRGIVTALTAFFEKHALKAADMSAMGFSYSQRCNWQKLQYWGLVEKANPLSKKGGEWRVTQRGAEFVSGWLRVPHFAVTYRAKVVRYEGDSKVIGLVLDGYKYRGDWAAAAIPAGRSHQMELLP